MAYVSFLTKESRERYLTKLKVCGLRNCPYELDDAVWKEKISEWPSVEYGDIHEYLINTPGIFTREAMKNRKSLASYNFFHSGWVGSIRHCFTESNLIVMLANVKHSQSMNEKPLRPWVTAKSDGSIISAHCDCKAGYVKH